MKKKNLLLCILLLNSFFYVYAQGYDQLNIIKEINNSPLIGVGVGLQNDDKPSENALISIGIVNNQLILEANQQKIPAFLIKVEGVFERDFKQRVSKLGFLVSKRKVDGVLNYLAYSKNYFLTGRVVLADIKKNEGVLIKSAVFLDLKSDKIPYKFIDEKTLGIEDAYVKDYDVFYKTFNYPNPFNYQTTISYLSDRLDDKVVLNVYAQNGSLVLTKTIQAVKGDNKYLFTNKGLSSGVYYYTIKFSDNLNSSLKGKLFIE